MNIQDWLTQARPVIGMIHLLALPGAPKWQGSLEQVLDRACADAKTYAAAGFDAILVENFGDLPFSSTVVEPHIVAAMAWILTNLRREVAMPMGVNVLRNDWRAALALAATCGGSFIRVNVHCGVMITDQGMITGNAHDEEVGVPSSISRRESTITAFVREARCSYAMKIPFVTSCVPPSTMAVTWLFKR